MFQSPPVPPLTALNQLSDRIRIHKLRNPPLPNKSHKNIKLPPCWPTLATQRVEHLSRLALRFASKTIVSCASCVRRHYTIASQSLKNFAIAGSVNVILTGMKRLNAAHHKQNDLYNYNAENYLPHHINHHDDNYLPHQINHHDDDNCHNYFHIFIV